MSGVERKAKIPDAPTLPSVPVNLLSSVAPPTQLPNFITATPTTQSTDIAPSPVPIQPIIVNPRAKEDTKTEGQEVFSPVIPLSAQVPPGATMMSAEEIPASSSFQAPPEATTEHDKIGDIMPGSALFSWMKGAVSGGGLLQKVAEKAKSSVDTMITTLDPQMKEYLNSGGGIVIVVASDKEVKVSPVREAFQSIFGKATVIGYPAESDVTATQPVGYASAYAAAKQRIAHIRSTHADLTNNVPIVAIESFLHEAVNDRWYDIALLVLSQPSLGIELQMQSQGTPAPTAAVLSARESTPEDYPHRNTGFSTTVGAIVGDSLQVPHTQWQESTTGVSRREILLLAARSLVGSYKKLLAVSAAET